MLLNHQIDGITTGGDNDVLLAFFDQIFIFAFDNGGADGGFFDAVNPSAFKAFSMDLTVAPS
jgi:hypothetical protein